MGKRILLAVPGTLGDIHPYLAVAKALQARGHEPVLLSHIYHAPVAQQAGVSFHAIWPSWNWSDPTFIRQAMDPKSGTRFLARQAALHAEEMFHDVWRASRGADLMLTHGLGFGAQIVAEELRMPRIAGVLAPISFLSTHDPPLPPNMGWFRHVRYWHPPLTEGILRMGKQMTQGWLGPVQRLRQQRGLPPGRHPMFEGRFACHLVLGLYPSLLGPLQPDFPRHTVLTGFASYRQPLAPHQAPALHYLRTFLQEGPPPVVISLGSTAAKVAARVQQVFVAAARRLRQRVVVLTSAHITADFPRSDKHILVLPHLPHHLVVPHAAAVVHHGGIGTLGQALHAGKPQVIVPFAHDQPDNADRATRLGVGVCLRPGLCSVTRAQFALQRVLYDSNIQDQAQCVQDLLADEDGSSTAADAIENLLLGRPPMTLRRAA